MTKKRRWPKAANEHRLDAMTKAEKIEQQLYKDLLDAIERRNIPLAQAIAREIKVEAIWIKQLLENAPAGEE